MVELETISIICNNKVSIMVLEGMLACTTHKASLRHFMIDLKKKMEETIEWQAISIQIPEA